MRKLLFDALNPDGMVFLVNYGMTQVITLSFTFNFCLQEKTRNN